MESLRPGVRGPAVVVLQARLRALGYWLGEADGTYGPLAEQAVTAFQKIEGLVPDGAAGPATLEALAVAERPTTSGLRRPDRGRQGTAGPLRRPGWPCRVDPQLLNWHGGGL